MHTKTSSVLFLLLMVFHSIIFSAENYPLMQPEEFINNFNNIKLDKFIECFGKFTENQKSEVQKSLKDKKITSSAVVSLLKKASQSETLSIQLYQSWSQSPYPELESPELSQITPAHLNAIFKAQSNALSQQELVLLQELPDSLEEKLKPYYCLNEYWNNGTNNYRIKFQYRHKITLKSLMKEIINNQQANILYTLALLSATIYNCYMTTSLWPAISGTQDRALLQHNEELKLSNALIDQLKKNNPQSTAHLIKHVIQKVPFEYSRSDHMKIALTLIPPSLVMAFIWKILPEEIDRYYDIGIGRKYYDETPRWNIGKIPNYIHTFPELFLITSIYGTFFMIINSILLGAEISIFNTPGYSFNGLYMGATAVMLGYSLIQLKQDLYRWKQQSIDLETDKTIAQSIQKYLDDNSIEIQ